MSPPTDNLAWGARSEPFSAALAKQTEKLGVEGDLTSSAQSNAPGRPAQDPELQAAQPGLEASPTGAFSPAPISQPRSLEEAATVLSSPGLAPHTPNPARPSQLWGCRHLRAQRPASECSVVDHVREGMTL